MTCDPSTVTVFISGFPKCALSCIPIEIETLKLVELRARDGVLHEFSSIPSVREDVTSIILNIKEIALRVHSEGAKRMVLKKEGGGAVRAKDIEAGADVEIEYHSFELAPDTPVDFDGTPVDYLSQRKGLPITQVEEMLERVAGIASSVGLDYDYDHVHQTNTVISHELIHFAKSKGRQLEMKERLLKAYFVNGEHVGRIPDLVEIAVELGYDRDEVTEALESHRFLADVKADVALAQEYGIRGVPFFVIDGKYGVSGAQESATFANVLTQVQSERDAQ